VAKAAGQVWSSSLREFKSRPVHFYSSQPRRVQHGFSTGFWFVARTGPQRLKTSWTRARFEIRQSLSSQRRRAKRIVLVGRNTRKLYKLAVSFAVGSPER